MFEQASIDTRGMLKSPWAITASVAGQTLALSAGILVSLIHTDALPRASLITTIAAPTATLKRDASQSVSATVQRAKTSHRVFVLQAKSTDRTGAKSQNAAISLSPGDIAIDSGQSAGNGALSIGGPGIPGGVIVHLPGPPPPLIARQAEKQVAPVASKPVTVSSGVQAAKLTRQVKPSYPPLAVQAHISGTVRLAAIIGRDGTIQNLQAVSGHPLLTPAAVEAVRQWRYQPTLLNGQAVEVITQIDVNFSLSR
jgi:periplasmic protein TonB